MFIPTYLQRSRHGVFYFRWSLPKQPDYGRSPCCIKFSLRTREPQQALRLATPLRYLAQRLIERGAHRQMNHKELRDLVHQHFAKLVANAKVRIDNEGPLSEAMQGQLRFKPQVPLRLVIYGKSNSLQKGNVDARRRWILT